MGASVGPNKGGAKSDINVTPLIDIVLVLLIVFIVMVPGLTKALNATVPQVVTTTTPPPPVKDNPPLVVAITKSNDVEVNSTKTDLTALTDMLVPIFRGQPINNRKVFFKVDEDVTYGFAVQVMDAIRAASDKAKAETLKDPAFQGLDGGDAKVAISRKKRV